jgi:hypothetical protein
MNYKLFKRGAAGVALAAVIALLGACATSPVVSQSTESTLLSSGFKAKGTTTAKQRQKLQTLPAGQISAVNVKGKTRYIYPDRANDTLYVGDAAAYQKLQASVPPQRDSSAPLRYTWTTPERNIPVEVFQEWTPFDEL